MKHWSASATAIMTGLAMASLVFLVSREAELTFTLTVGGIGVMAGAVLTALLDTRTAEAPTLQQRVEAAVTALRDASRVVVEIEAEINSTAERMVAVQQRLAEDSELADVKAEQAAAVRSALAGELHRDRRRERRREWLVKPAIAIIGAGAGKLFERVVS